MKFEQKKGKHKRYVIKAVFDTNVLVSGIASFKHPTRAPAQLLHAWRAGLFELYTSEHIMAELKKTLERHYFKSKLDPRDIDEAIILLSEECTVITTTKIVRKVATHPEDDLVISAAISGNVDYLVTGDKPLLNKVGNSYQGVSLITPNDFLKILRQFS